MALNAQKKQRELVSAHKKGRLIQFYSKDDEVAGGTLLAGSSDDDDCSVVDFHWDAGSD